MTDRRGGDQKLWQSAFLFSVAFFLCAELGRLLSVQPFWYVTFWLPAGLYVGVLLLYDTRAWPRFILAALPANLLFDGLYGTPLPTILGFYCANTIQAVAGAWLVRRFVAEKPELTTLREFFGLLVCSALASSVLGTTIGTIALTLSGLSHSFWPSWRTWWGDQAMAILLLTPFILVWLGEAKSRKPLFRQPGRLVEAALLAAALVVCTWYMLVVDKGIDAPYKSRLMPLLLWAGLRFGLRGVTAANLLFALVLEFCTTHFLKGLTPGEITSGSYVTTLQSFLAVSVFMTLIPTIIINDRDRKMTELQDSEERFRLLSDNLPASMVYQFLREPGGAVRFLHVSAGMERLHGLSAEAVRRDFSLFFNQFVEADRAVIVNARDASEKSLEVFNVTVRIRRADGEWRWMNLRSAPRRLPDGRTVWDGIETDITERKLAEESLGQSEERFARMFNNSPMPVSLLRLADGVFLDVNESFLRMSGFAREEVIGHTALELKIYPDPGQRAFILERLRQDGHLHGYEKLFRAKSGRIRNNRLWFEVISINGEDCYLVLALDITEQKQAETALRQSEERFARIFKSSPMPITLSRLADGAILDANERFFVMSGFTREEVIGHTALELNAYPDPAQRAVIMEQVRRQGHLHGFAQQFRTKSGRIRDHLLWLDVISISGEECLLVLALDITEQKQVEASHARLVTVVEQTSEAIVITDTEGTILYVNPAFEKTSGYASAEAVGRNPRLLKSGRQEAGFYRQMWDVLQRGEVWRGHFINRRKDGTLYEEEATISPVRDVTGKVINYAGVNRDVTHEVQLEAELRQSQKMEAIGQLAGGVAHDFNNILSALLMQTDLVAMVGNLPAEVHDGLQEIRNDVNRASELTRQLLLFSRRQVMQVRLLNLNELIMNLGRMLQRVIREDVQLQLHLSATPLMTRADPGMLEQVLMNLTVNARDAMPGGGQLHIETAETTVPENDPGLNPEAVPGRYVSVSVSDTGGGIPPEVLPRIFEPFFTTKEAGKGTGLGLATVFGIVKQHRGWIKVDSRPGEGVTFQVFLPASEVTVLEPAPREVKPKPRGGAETILLVEDELAVRSLARKFLEWHGYHVLEAANGVEALQCWEKNRATVSLLLTDLVMPGGMNGQELARRLQAEQPRIKVVYTSGYSPDIAGRDFKLRTGESFVQKPFAPNDLLEAIRQRLDG